MTTRSSGVVVVLAVLGCGCHQRPPPRSAATIRASDLPRSTDRLIAYADEEMAKGTPASVENSLVALDLAVGIEPENLEARWRAARACGWLSEDYRDRRADFARRGLDHARVALKIAPNRVEPQYYLAINLGLSATTKTIGAVELVPQVVKAAKEAAQADEAFDHAGPLRLLGSVYAKAPVWPVSVGDPDEGVKILRRAVELAPFYPANHLFYADALAADDRLGDAEREYQAVLRAPTTAGWAYKQRAWRRAAEAALKRLSKKH